MGDIPELPAVVDLTLQVLLPEFQQSVGDESVFLLPWTHQRLLTLLEPEMITEFIKWRLATKGAMIPGRYTL